MKHSAKSVKAKNMRSTDLNKEKIIINKYNSGTTMAEVAKELGISTVTVMNILNRNNIPKRNKGGIYPLDENFVVNEYNSGKSSGQISRELGVCPKTICNILDKHGIARNNRYHNLGLVENYWQVIDSPDKAYFLGLMITDGNIYDNTIRLELSSKDYHILKTFSEKTGNENKISIDKRNLARFTVKRDSWVLDLSKYGVIPNKTSSVYLPTLDQSLMPHLIRGLIDGDGWITYKGHAIGFCGNDILTTQVRDFLVNTLGVYNVKVSRTEQNLWSILWCSKRDIKAIGDYIYQDKSDCYLIRKFNNFEKIIQADTEVTPGISKGPGEP